MIGSRYFIFVLAVITGVKGNCDQVELGKCTLLTASLSTEPDQQKKCEIFNNFKSCVDPLRDICREDLVSTVSLEQAMEPICGDCQVANCFTSIQPFIENANNQQIEPSQEFCQALTAFKNCVNMIRPKCESSNEMLTNADRTIALYDTVCSGCKVMTCQTSIQKYMPQTGGEPKKSDELCRSVTEFKNCVERQRPTCDANDEMLKNVDMMLSRFDVICANGVVFSAACTSTVMMDCIKHVRSIASSEFEGYPTETQVNEACPKYEKFKNCAAQLKGACETTNTEAGKQILGAIKTISNLMELICGNQNKANFVKYGKECFETSQYVKKSKMCFKTPANNNSMPAAEDKEVMCQRILETFECHNEKTKDVCSDEAADFVENMTGKYFTILSDGFGCQANDGIRIGSQPWMYIALMISSILLY